MNVSAAEWLTGYYFFCTWWSADRRQSGIPEFSVPRRVAPAALLAVVYRQCKDAFGSAMLPIEFQIGKEELNFEEGLRLHSPPTSTILAEREFLRFCLSYLDKRTDWTKEDYFLRFSRFEGQLRIEGKSETIYCPARGNWSGIGKVSARMLFRRLPKRLLYPVTALQQKDDALLIDGYLIPADWVL